MSVKKINDISEIPQMKYSGYIWFSDAQKPQLLHNQEFPIDGLTLNPFIVEGWLWNEDLKVSILIQHSGKYHVRLYDLKEFLKTPEYTRMEFLPNRMPGIERLYFTPYWMEEEDALCMNFPVLKSKGYVFVGFNK